MDFNPTKEDRERYDFTMWLGEFGKRSHSLGVDMIAILIHHPTMARRCHNLFHKAYDNGISGEEFANATIPIGMWATFNNGQDINRRDDLPF